MTQNIVSRCNGLGDGNSPAVVVGNQLVRCPCAWFSSVADQSTFIDLDEFQISFGDVRAVAVAIGKVGDNGAVMAVGPCSPLELDGATSGNWSRECSRGGTLMADNIGVGILGAVNEAEIGCSSCPANNSWWVRFIGELSDNISRIAKKYSHVSRR